jgi:DNA-3-methyladenine glycosylase II
MDYFQYGQDVINYLKKKDKKLGLAIDRIGIIKREVIPDKFTALVTCIVGQQISNKAAETVWNRLCELLKEITPQTIADTDMENIQKCGMSVRKANYIKGIGDAVIRGELDFAKFDDLSNDEIIKRLSSLHGVGVWTAEMLLIFSMERANVLSWDDLAIKRGIMNLYGLKELTRLQFERYKKRYAPFGTVASLYLWALSCE